MIHSRIFSICLICLSVSACNTQEQALPVKNTTETIIVPQKAVPEKIANQKPVTMKTRPILNLSIDNMHVDQHINDDNFLTTGKEPAENNNTLFKTPGKNQIEPRINLSGKVFTDEEKVKNKEYLDSVDGVQINIQGNFN